MYIIYILYYILYIKYNTNEKKTKLLFKSVNYLVENDYKAIEKKMLKGKIKLRCTFWNIVINFCTKSVYVLRNIFDLHFCKRINYTNM